MAVGRRPDVGAPVDSDRHRAGGDRAQVRQDSPRRSTQRAPGYGDRQQRAEERPRDAVGDGLPASAGASSGQSAGARPHSTYAPTAAAYPAGRDRGVIWVLLSTPWLAGAKLIECTPSWRSCSPGTPAADRPGDRKRSARVLRREGGRSQADAVRGRRAPSSPRRASSRPSTRVRRRPAMNRRVVRRGRGGRRGGRVVAARGDTPGRGCRRTPRRAPRGGHGLGGRPPLRARGPAGDWGAVQGRARS